MVNTAETGRIRIVTERSSRIEGTCTILELVDVKGLQKILDEFSEATGFNVGIISYPDQKLLAGTGWRPLCNKFHLACPGSAQFCSENHGKLAQDVDDQGGCVIRSCKNGLADGAAAVFVRGRRLATVFSGQIFVSEPDAERFREQARTHGYELDSYLEALSHVPVVAESRFRKALSFLGGSLAALAELKLETLEAAERTAEKEEDIAALRQAEKVLDERERRYRELYRSSRDGYMRCDLKGRFREGNTSFLEMLGCTIDELKERTCWNITPKKWHNQEKREIFEKGCDASYRKEFIKKDGGVLPVEVTTHMIRDKDNTPLGWWSQVRDLTDRKRSDEMLADVREEVAALQRERDALEDERESVLREVERAKEESRAVQNVLHETRQRHEETREKYGQAARDLGLARERNEELEQELEKLRKALVEEQEEQQKDAGRTTKPAADRQPASGAGRKKRGGRIRAEEIFDRAGALDGIGGGDALLDAAVDHFLGRMPHLIKSLKDAQGERDMDMVRCQARAVGGMAARVGALRIREKALDLETFSREGRLGRVPSHVKKLERELRRFKKTLPS